MADQIVKLPDKYNTCHEDHSGDDLAPMSCYPQLHSRIRYLQSHLYMLPVYSALVSFILVFVLFSCSTKNTGIPDGSQDLRLTIEAVSGDGPLLTSESPGADGNKYGFEGGTVIRLRDGYHLFTSEMTGDPRWVKMKLAHWRSGDGKEWKRISTIRESSGNFTGKDPRAAIWSPMPVYNEGRGMWMIHYIGYKSRPDSGGIWLANYEGRVFRLASKTTGREGIDGPYHDAGLIMEPGIDSDPFEGLQGTDSFFPYRAGGKYYAFYGSARTQHLPITLWQLGLASADGLEGPWKRCSALNPVDLGMSFTENPVVTRLDNGLYVAVVDAGYDSTGFQRSAFGYFYSSDGINWSKEQLCQLENKVPRWWTMMRTPLCLIRENDGTYTVFYTAYDRNNYGSLGRIRVKLDIVSDKTTSYKDGRPSCSYRMEAADIGVVLAYGDGPDSCDIHGARDLWVYRANDSVYCMHYDAAGPSGWLAALATSRDLVHWQKKGPVLNLGGKDEPDSKSASYGTTYSDGKKWHMFYLGTPNVTPAPDFIPSFPYLNLKAESESPFGPWVKQRGVIPFEPKEGTFYSSTASPGFIVKQGDEYMMFFSAADYSIKRTLCIARTRDLDSPWKIDSSPILPASEQVENSSVYFEPSNHTWFLFTNHVGIDDGGEYTDAVWVYWSTDPTTFDPATKRNDLMFGGIPGIRR